MTDSNSGDETPEPEFTLDLPVWLEQTTPAFEILRAVATRCAAFADPAFLRTELPAAYYSAAEKLINDLVAEVLTNTPEQFLLPWRPTDMPRTVEADIRALLGSQVLNTHVDHFIAQYAHRTRNIPVGDMDSISSLTAEMVDRCPAEYRKPEPVDAPDAPLPGRKS